MKSIYVHLLLICCVPIISNAQSNPTKVSQKNYAFIGINYHDGNILPTNDFVRGENLSVGMNIRSVNFMLAEFLEFNVGYRIRWKK